MTTYLILKALAFSVRLNWDKDIWFVIDFFSENQPNNQVIIILPERTENIWSQCAIVTHKVIKCQNSTTVSVWLGIKDILPNTFVREICGSKMGASYHMDTIPVLPHEYYSCHVIMSDRVVYVYGIGAWINYYIQVKRRDVISLPRPQFNGHDDVIKWEHFSRYWPFKRGIHRWLVNSPHKGQWRGALMIYSYHYVENAELYNCVIDLNHIQKDHHCSRSCITLYM